MKANILVYFLVIHSVYCPVTPGNNYQQQGKSVVGSHAVSVGSQASTASSLEIQPTDHVAQGSQEHSQQTHNEEQHAPSENKDNSIKEPPKSAPSGPKEPGMLSKIVRNKATWLIAGGLTAGTLLGLAARHRDKKRQEKLKEQ